MRRAATLLAIVVALAAAGLTFMYAQARADPVVRAATVHMPDWPAGAAPVTAVLWSDLHVTNPATDRTRLRRIVGRVNALTPDLVLIAGDFVGDERLEDGSIAALSALQNLRPRLGTVAVLGNHDHLSDPAAVRRALTAAGIVLLSNEAVRRGPLVVGGLDDMVTGHAQFGRTFDAVHRLKGPKLLLSHTPDVIAFMPPDASLLLAGHTHCGQIVLPWYGALFTGSRYGGRYRCGLIREGSRTIVVGAGTGTSILPLRLGAPPDLWLITLGP